MWRVAILFLGLSVSAAFAEPPHYVSQRGDAAFLREGPSYQYKILWVYRHRGYPFRVVASFDVWRRVVAADGATGWMNADVLSDQRTVLITGKGRVQIHETASGGKVVGLADPGAVAFLKNCAALSCHIHGQEIDGWVARDRVWGVDGDEFSR